MATKRKTKARKQTRARKQKKTYRATPGAQFPDRDAQVIGERLEELGPCTPQRIVQDATPMNAALHPYFDWDDSHAANEYRKRQAGNMANHIVIVVHTNDGEEETRAFHNVVIKTEDEEAGERAYVSVERVAGDSELSSQIVQKALAELIGWKKRYRQYGIIFAPVVEAIDEVGDLIKEADPTTT